MNENTVEPWAERLTRGLERSEDFKTLFRNRLASNKELVQVFLKRNPFRRRHDKDLVTHWSQLLNTTTDSSDIEEIAFYMSIQDLEWKFGQLHPAEQHVVADKAWSLVMPEGTRLSRWRESGDARTVLLRVILGAIRTHQFAPYIYT